MLIPRAASSSSSRQSWSHAALSQTAQRKRLSRLLPSTITCEESRAPQDLMRMPAWIKTRRKKTIERHWTQKSLRFRNFPPSQRRDKPLPLWIIAAREWLAERFHNGTGSIAEMIALMPHLQKMRVDDCLLNGQWRLELVWLGRGAPQFRLYWRTHLFGVAYINNVKWGEGLIGSLPFERVQQEMARYLVRCGWTAAGTALVVGKARTPTDEPRKDQLPTLW
jgi:hypothetical protein